MNILVTGAAGFIGSSLTQHLAENNFSIKAVDCFLPDSYNPNLKRENWKELSVYKNIELIEYDLRNELPINLLDGVDVVVNEAAMPGLMKSWSDFNLYSSCNFNVVENLVRRSQLCGVNHFIQISTSSVYGLNATGSEESQPLPVSPYGVTKLAAEEIIKTYNRTFGLNYTILRYFSVFGPRQRPDMFYNKLIRAIWDDQPLEIFGDGSQSRTNTYIQDCVEGTVSAILSKPNNEIYNISGFENRTLLETIKIIEEKLDKKANLIFREKRPGDQLHTNGIIQKAQSHLGYAPKVGLEEGLQRQISWQVKNMQKN